MKKMISLQRNLNKFRALLTSPICKWRNKLLAKRIPELQEVLSTSGARTSNATLESNIPSARCLGYQNKFENSKVLIDADLSQWRVPSHITLEDANSMLWKTSNTETSIARTNLPVKSNHFLIIESEAEAGSALRLHWRVLDSETGEKLPLFNIDKPIDEKTGPQSSTLVRTFLSTKSVDIALSAFDVPGGGKVSVRLFSVSTDVLASAALPPKESRETIIASIASIPSREHILEDTIASLHNQVDEVRVYLNNYPSVPDYFAKYSKLKYERSQTHGDLGDAGKFFWAEDNTPGYRLTCDDDIIYPPNYVANLIKKMQDYDNQAVLGAHGIVLKQPVLAYYGKRRGITYEFGSSLSSDAHCHILGTGVLIYHTKTIRLSFSDFERPNMADIWFARAAQQQNVPLICYSREKSWLYPRLIPARASIYEQSKENTNSEMNTGRIQTEVLNALYPISTRRVASSGKKTKWFLGVVALNDSELLQHCIRSFLQTKTNTEDWVVAISDRPQSSTVREFLRKLIMPAELIVLDSTNKKAVDITNELFSLSQKMGADFGFIATDDIVFRSSGWNSMYKDAADHCVENLDLKCTDSDKSVRDEELDLHLENIDTDSHFCHPNYFCVFSSASLRLTGGIDKEAFTSHAEAAYDFNIRTRRAGYCIERYWPIGVSHHEFITTQHTLEQNMLRLLTNMNFRKNTIINFTPEQKRLLADENRIGILTDQSLEN